MRQVLGRKQSMKPETESLWWDVIDHIEDYVSRAEVDRAADIARARIVEMTNGKKAEYSWSGGKDSLAIAALCQSVGIYKCQCFFTNLEFPAWEKFLFDNAPAGCEMVNVGFGLDYLVDHPEMIFPRGQLALRWPQQVQRAQFLRHLLETDIDVLITGHRLIDGNSNCGTNGIRKKSGGKILFTPIFDWPHELLFAFLHYNNIPLPFIYKWDRGFFEGTHLWVERFNYQQVYDIDPSVVIQAAAKLPSAKKFLEKLNHANSHEKT